MGIPRFARERNPYVLLAKAREDAMAERVRRACDVCSVQSARCLATTCQRHR
jgi:hypothetical protein